MKKQFLSVLGLASLTNGLTENSSDEAVLEELRNVVGLAKRAETAETELGEFKKTQAKLLVANMAKEGKISAAEIPQFEADAIENYALVAKTSARMAGKVDPNANLDRKKDNPADEGQPEIMKGREAWNYSKWQTEDPKGLGKLEDTNPEAYEKLFKDEFNQEA